MVRQPLNIDGACDRYVLQMSLGKPSIPRPSEPYLASSANQRQVEAIERALEGEGECEEILQLVAPCRGALNGLMAELIEGHLRFHVLVEAQTTLPSQRDAAR
jgi:DNA-binding FrmR family transcriptional regulator